MAKEQNIVNENIDNNSERKRRNRKILFFVTFFSAVFISVATYAWLSSSLNVKIKFFEMTVQSDSGLFISLDGIDFSSEVVISMDSITIDLLETYPNHTNQWAAGGLWPVSSTGIKTANNDKFAMYRGFLIKSKQYNPNGTIKRTLNVYNMIEEEYFSNNIFISFDIFLKNVSGSPNPDNLYFSDTTGITYEEEVEERDRFAMDGIMNSMRMGIVFINSVPHRTAVPAIQNMQCNNNCRSLIFEPYAYNHSIISVDTAVNYGVSLIDGVYSPTYALTAIGKGLEHTNGHTGTGIPLDTAHFKAQQTLKDIDITSPIYQIPNGITKARVYVWIEGQDIDSLETYSKGTEILINIDLEKDLAGYQ